MKLNNFLFRAPVPSYTSSRFGEELIWVPCDSETSIPCLFLYSHQPTAKTFLYFHANAEDLGKIYDFLDIIRCVLEVNILAPEYPGYGIYKGNSSCSGIISDSTVIYNFMLQTLKIHHQNIYILGRSIGTGPATSIASRGAGALILISPYTSIRNAVKHMVGKFFQYVIKEQLPNIDYIKKVTCPILCIHGKKDKLIPCEHSYELARECTGTVKVVVSETMTHNKFEFYDDILCPIDKFILEYSNQQESFKAIVIPKELYDPPKHIRRQQQLLREFL